MPGMQLHLVVDDEQHGECHAGIQDLHAVQRRHEEAGRNQ